MKRTPRNTIRATDLGGDLVLVAVATTDLSAVEDPEPLSRGEQEVVELAARGLSNGEIAMRRKCSAHTVANQLASAYRKLGVSGRRELRARIQQERVDK